MPLPIRTPEETDALKARAREMRTGGASVTETAQALGVPASTLYRWAAEGGWRGRDLARERYKLAIEGAALRDAACGGSSGQAIEGSNTSSVPAHVPTLCRDLPEQAGNPEAWTGPGINPGQKPGIEHCPSPGASRHPLPGGGEGSDDDATSAPAMTPEEARAAGEKALRAARALMEAGDLRGATDALRLSEHWMAAARSLKETQGAAGKPRLTLEEARAIIGARIDKAVAAYRVHGESVLPVGLLRNEDFMRVLREGGTRAER